MCSQVSNFPASVMKTNDIPDTKLRSVANYHPSIWNDHFLSFMTFDDPLNDVDDGNKAEAQKLKEEMRMMVVDSMGNPLEKLKLVDSIQRLGVSYHFEEEIDEFLKHIYESYNSLLLSNKDSEDDDLHITSLLFRLLRQQGYRVSSDIFLKFMYKNGKFKESLVEDERGILSLYEASHMMGHGEGVLEEALKFTTTHLKTYIHHYSNVNPHFASEVSNALKLPIRKDLPRKKAREYLEIYQQHPSHNETLLKFSKLDFNILQKLHQKELSEICRWWKDLEVPTKFPFARDRIVECYFWTLGAYFEPQYGVGRKMLTKVIAISSILDDIYDAYGTFEELQVLTPAIQRWDRSMVHTLPEYMKPFYVAMLELYEEISKEIGKDQNSLHLQVAIGGMKKLSEAYFEEAKWLNKKYKPSFKEYMELALNTTGYTLLISISFLGLGDHIVTNEVLQWLSNGPQIIKASTIICRLMDDIVSHEFEQEREHVASAVELYMEQYNCSEEEACVQLHKEVVDAWKDTNEAFYRPFDVPMPVLMRVLNLSRVMNLVYLDEDGYTNAKSGTKFLIKSVLVDPLPC